MPGRLNGLRYPLLCVYGLFLFTARLPAENGELLSVSSPLGPVEVVDICFATDGTFWVLGANGSSTASHRIYHLSADLGTQLGFLENPHPPRGDSPVDLTTNRGIAFRNLPGDGPDHLLVLASVGPRDSQTLEVRLLGTDGAEVPGSEFTVTTPDDDASLYGLTYDLVSRELWSLDAQNDKVVRFNLAGMNTHSFVLPGKDTPYTTLRGKGIAYAFEDDGARLYVTLGDLFDRGPDRISQLTTDGQPTGVEIPLSALPTADLRGFDMFRRGLHLRRVALLGDDGQVFEIEQVISAPLPPSSLRCTLNRSNQVVLSWQNHGSGPDGAYGGEIQILRNDIAFTAVPGNATTFTDETPGDGVSTYSLRSSEDSGPVSEPSLECQVTVGTGGLIDWTSAPGSSLYDVTAHPETGEIWVTDNVQRRIFHLDSEFQLLGEIPNPWDDDNPGGIAFVPYISLGFPDPEPFENLLAVTRPSGNQLAFIDLQGNPKTTITLRFKDEAGNDIGSPRVGGLTFVPAEQHFMAVEMTQVLPRIHVMATDGRQVSSCHPPPIGIGSPLDHAITYDPIQESVLALFADGFVRELYPQGGCTWSQFQFDLTSLGEISSSPSFAAGFQIDGSTLLVCERATSTLFRVLIFPFSPSFVRGDFDGTGEVNLTDAVRLANYLFRAQAAPSCQDAADANDDGILDVADPVYLLFWLFIADSPQPPPPYPEPGEDPTFRDNLGCEG